MIILFIHQNFPGQFKFLAPALVKQGHQVLAMTMRSTEAKTWQGVTLVPYISKRSSTPNIHPWVSDFETKTIRADACFHAAYQLKNQGINPNLIIAHSGWGESLFIKDVWPTAKLAVYWEFYYHSRGADVNFDPEFLSTDPSIACHLRLKNLNNLMHLTIADAAISPTRWQASTFPIFFQDKISVIHDGINTTQLIPNPQASITLNNTLTLTNNDEIVTFVNRNLEPYRGYHIFMRALPEILKRRPKAHILIVGGDGVSYGAKSPTGQSWKQIFANEVHSQMPTEDWARIHFLGRISYNYFVSLLQLSSVHVYLTYPFVLSWSLLEAMSCGCAVVASDTQPLHEVIQHDDNGLLVNFFDVAGLADQVCKLLDDPTTRQRLGIHAREFAQANYDLSTVCLPQQLAWVLESADS